MKKTILVIEDEKVTRNNLLQFLDSEGFNTIGAENGNVGIKLANDFIPDLIICDILMPHMDGYDVLFNLQQNPQTKEIPFIFLTVTNEQNVLFKNELLNEDDYLQKPVTSKQLIRAINNKLNKAITKINQSSLEQELSFLKTKVHNLEEYNQTKDFLMENLCNNLQQYLPLLKEEIKSLNSSNSSLSTEQRESLDRIQKNLMTILSLIDRSSELQKMINLENYQLLEQFPLTDLLE